ncbi:outer membrane beta-barrel protein [Rhizorhabdus argentea]|uniref:outer membrane beta-barrel protein n=1 Tax=Rhizorhabdus argentea TaxID=1387174 RepID=UPI0030EF2D22
MRYLLLASVLGLGVPSVADSADRDPGVANLPRSGYEPRTIIIGSVVIRPTIDLYATYDDNIFATRTAKVDDTIASISPRVEVQRPGSAFDFTANAHGDIIRYKDNSRENVNLFGGGIDASTSLTRRQALSASLSFDRGFERRSDPEATTDRSRPPALTNIASGELRYRLQGSRFGAVVDLQATKIDYLPLRDADRDLLTYRVAVRGLVKVTHRISVFAEPYVNRRDARLRVDRSGINRDATTTGLLAGVSFDLADKLQGDAGIGVFKSNPRSPVLRSFRGVAANARLVWRPQRRTSVSIDGFRGDVATIRAGAIGRVDTRFTLTVEQEVRHNLLLHASAGLRDVHYRGSIGRDQRYKNGELELRYLLDRHFALSLGASHSRRSADDPEERFARWRTTLGLHMVY